MDGQRFRTRWWALGLVALATVLAGCSGGSPTDVAAVTGTEPTAVVPDPTVVATSTPVAEPTAVATVPDVEPTPTASPVPDQNCRRVEDFGVGAADRWRIVNDGVMGGLSQGEAEIVGDAIRFSGVIETDGGGFSSVRSLLEPGALADATELRVRARSDGRAYEVIADDAADGRDARVSHFGAIPLEGTDWEEVVIVLDQLAPRVFGTPVDDLAFQPDAATSFGIILADGSDGPFLLEVDWIDACR